MMAPRSIGFMAILGRFRYLLSSHRWLTPPTTRRRGKRSIFIRHLDTGSCNDSELEIIALSNPIYDFERFGFYVVASPRHADVLLVTGPFTRSMEAAALVAFRAMPEPRRLITVGDGFRPDGIFQASYAITPLPEEMTSAWLAHIFGDPPSPQQILDVLLTLDTK